KRSDQEQEQEYKKKKKIFDNVVDYNDQLIVCENCRRPIIVWDIIIILYQSTAKLVPNMLCCDTYWVALL
ncbi:MAG: hypothetical protein ACJ712_02610, partial [Nitrososphaeraceae archaeon]